ncbi:MAG: hypothetical protein LBR80_18105 [Deltaproteobacteria bacterium]|jgi:hypothetical protein|nr:hypothetical protein [Deltaproteobacteria bacterium]
MGGKIATKPSGVNLRREPALAGVFRARPVEGTMSGDLIEIKPIKVGKKDVFCVSAKDVRRRGVSGISAPG